MNLVPLSMIVGGFLVFGFLCALAMNQEYEKTRKCNSCKDTENIKEKYET